MGAIQPKIRVLPIENGRWSLIDEVIGCQYALSL